jgi:hypothetical protein
MMMAKKFTAPQYSKFISVISRYAHPASAGFCLAILHRPTAFSVAIFCPALQPYPTPSLGRCDGTADRRRRGPEHARADRNDASTAKAGAESGTGTTPETRGDLPDRGNCLAPNECFDGRTTLLYFVFTVTFSAQLHKAHSKVRVSTPSGPDTKPANVIGPWHFGHGGRSISMRSGSAMRDCGMVLPA